MPALPAPPRLQPALLGGAFIGVLSALPIISVGNCCCLWVIGGGILAAYLMQQNYPYPISAADGALVGLLAGVFGGIIGAVLSIPLALMMAPFQERLLERIMANPDMPQEYRGLFENMNRAGAALAFRFVFAIIGIVVGAVFAMLGGLLGVALFRKRLPPTPPPGTVEILPPA
ncbi:MAG TPA: DUF5518 domain-containing protein [Vicinamibacterales bacterium]|nr:DUF5518 domain-containing protein [Vicinamibacterales bacterium]